MAEDREAAGVSTSAGHLYVHVEGAHPAEVPFLIEHQRARLSGSLGVAFGCHVAAVLVIVIMVHLGHGYTEAILPEKVNDSMVWLAEPGPGGGGGGGGNQMKEPPRKAELPGKDKLTVPALKAPSVAPVMPKKPEPEPVQMVQIPVQTLASAAEYLPGAIEAPPGPPTASLGSGSGGGAGTGQGTGIGPGQGSGLGPGSGGGTGGGAYRPGSGVTIPEVVRQVKPQYTSEAMRARIQGSVEVECVVRTDGTVGDVHVVRSLDPRYGLDDEAVKAARQWRFRPGTRLGEPVPVLVTIELTFTLR
jgi:periplasmic protein TonB